MHWIKKVNLLVIGFGLLVTLTACAPEVGSEEWCAELKKNPKGDWTIDETTNYAKHCLL